MATVQEALAAAYRLQMDGRIGEAEALYRRILDVCPDHVDAWHLSGLAARRRGDHAGAVHRMRRAAACFPGLAEVYNNLGNALRDAGGQAAAAALFHRAIRLKPDLSAPHAGLAGALRDLGRREAALDVWRDAAALLPLQAEVRNGLGNALQELDRPEAVEAYRAAIALAPEHAAAHANLAAAVRGAGRPCEAADLQRRALRLQPDFPAALSGLGLSLAELGHTVEAVALHARALALQPDFAGAESNRASALLALNRAREATVGFARAVRIAPALPDPHRNLGIALLLQGRLAEGWPEYEWRLRCSDSKTPPELPRPRWDGGPLDGRTILLHAEQGLGDTLQFARYVPLVAERGGRVVLCAPAALERPLASLSGVARFVRAGEPVSGYDVHAPLLTLPLLFGTTLAAVPASVPYLRPEPAQAAEWKERLAGEAGFRVGVVWAGSPGHGNDRNRSLRLDALAPLAAVPGVRLVSIQKGPPEEAARTPPAGMPLLNLSPEIADFGDTAAIVANLDLVVTVDTSVAHLAGALGRPTWVLLPYAPDWRWMLEGDESPWYPTMRLYRQTAPGAWKPVLARVAGDLDRRING